MTPLDLPALRAVLERATPGPWYAVKGGSWPTHYLRGTPYSNPEMAQEGHRYQVDCEQFTVSSSPKTEGWETDGGHPGYGIHRDDAHAIAAMRNAMPALLAELEAARDLVASVRSASAGWVNTNTSASLVREALSAYDAATKGGG